MQRSQKPLFTILSFLGFCIVLLMVDNQINETKAKCSHKPVAEVTRVSESGTPSIGGSFALIDQAGKQRQDTDFRGKYMLVYFGYSYCPDICPAALSAITESLNQLGTKAEQVQPIFITLDPERDNVAQLATYTQNFHPRLVALTGSADQIKQATTAYRVYATKAASDGTTTEYLLDHSSIIYLMDRQGRFVAHFNHATPPAEISAKLRQLI